jgi:hypothetical protein
VRLYHVVSCLIVHFCLGQDVVGKMPGALLVLAVGVVVAVVQYPVVVCALRLGPATPRIVIPTIEEWKTGGHRQLQPSAVVNFLQTLHLSS